MGSKGLVVLVLVGACSDGGSVPDGPRPIDASPDAPLRKTGSIGIVEDTVMNYSAWLAFFGSDLDVTITSRDDGPCHIEQASANSGARLVSAGTITISGGAAAAVTLVPDADNNYFAMVTDLSYVGGDQLSISSSGATVPAFASMATFPASVTLTSPIPTSVSKSGLTVTWNATASPMRISIDQNPSSGPRLNIKCVYNGASGTGTVPSSALAELTTTIPARIGISTHTDVLMNAGEYTIELVAIYGVVMKTVPVQP